jgi:sugar phosphate isomerase/epimerase
MSYRQNRRDFFQSVAALSLSTLLMPQKALGFSTETTKINLCGHLWVYASKYPPNWDCTPILEQVFSDMSYAGLYGVELMEVLLRPADAVSRMSEYSKKHNINVSGSSYGVGFQMCDKEQHSKIWGDIQLIVPRLSKLGGKTFGISVGGVGRKKTEFELDQQAELLKKIMKFCEEHGIQPNLHNHTYEVENDLYDLKGTLERIPDAKLGPDVNWLIRGG